MSGWPRKNNSLSAIYVFILSVLSVLNASVSSVYGAASSQSDRLDDSSETMQVAVDLQNDASLARQNCQVMVIMLAGFTCTYCHLLKREIFEPMLKNAQYQKALMLRELFIDEGETVLDFNGDLISGENFSDRYTPVRFTPTVIFLDPVGQSLADPIIGISNIQFYGYDLDQRLEQARVSLGGCQRLN